MMNQNHNQDKNLYKESLIPLGNTQHKKQIYLKMKQKVQEQSYEWKKLYQNWDYSNQNIAICRQQRMFQCFELVLRSLMLQTQWTTQLSELFNEIRLNIEVINQLIFQQLKKIFFDYRFVQAFYRILWEKMTQELWNEFYSSNFSLIFLIKGGNKQQITQWIRQKIVQAQKEHGKLMEQPRFSDDEDSKQEKKVYELGKNLHIDNYQYNNYHLAQLLDQKFLTKFSERFIQLPQSWRSRLQFNLKRVFDEYY